MNADLHLHSTFSDGALTPTQLTARVKEAGLGLFALTDHDGMEGADEAVFAAKEQGILTTRGWEISSYLDCKVHVLGYRCNRGKAYDSFLQKRIESSYLRAEDMIKKAGRILACEVSMSEVERFHLNKQTPVHTMFVVRAFAEKLHRDTGTLYKQLFNYGMPAYSGIGRPTPHDAVDTVHACGGIAFVAHVGRIGKEGGSLEKLLDSLVERGLDGIECHYPTHTVNQTKAFLKYAADRELLVGGGSDFHYDGGGRTIGKPDFTPSDKLLSALFD